MAHMSSILEFVEVTSLMALYSANEIPGGKFYFLRFDPKYAYDMGGTQVPTSNRIIVHTGVQQQLCSTLLIAIVEK